MQTPTPQFIDSQLLDPLAAETARVRSAYARRAKRYRWSSIGHEFGTQERERNTLALLRRYACMPLTEKTILDVGCGSGAWIQQFIRWGALPEKIVGIELRPDALARARNAVPAAVRLDLGNAASLPYEPAQFDIVLQSTVFTSVLDSAIRRAIAAEMLRVLKPDGLIIWYDFSVNNPKNPDVSGVPKPEIVSLFSGCRVDLKRVTLVPPVLRWVAERSWFLTYALSNIPAFCTHYLGAITKMIVHRC